MKIIILTKGYIAKVDDEDFEELSKFKWHVSKSNIKYYAARVEQKNNKKTKIYMHRWLKKAPCGVVVDHKDRDSLNNQKSNLRRCSTGQNMANTSTFGASKFKGVSVAEKGKWRARVYFKKKCISLGRFDFQEDAARAYDKKAIEVFEEFANLNFPDEWVEEMKKIEDEEPPF